MLKLNLFRKNYFFALILAIYLIINIPELHYSQAVDIIYPEYNGENVIDLSQKFDSNYVSRLKGELNQSDKEIRIVFINSENKINLSFYAPKLFDKWQMSDDSVLAVIDPYLNKTGYAIGKAVREEIKQRKVEKNTDNKKSVENKKLVDYDNLVSAIMDKFSPEQIKVKSDKKNKDANKIDSGVSYKSESDSSKEKSKANVPSPDDNKNKIIIFSLLGAILIIGGGIYFYNVRANNKRQLELKTNYSFDADLLQQDLSVLIEKLDADIEKMKMYDGTTLEKIIIHIEKLENNSAKSKVFLDRLNDQLEDLDIDNLGYLRDILDEGGLLKTDLEELHMESVALRKEFKSILKKSDMSKSDIRVNIENCKNTMEEIRTLYKLNLEHSETMIMECESLLSEATNILRDNDPAGFKITLKTIQSIIKNLKRDFDIIPHLYKQLQDNIPLNVESSLQETLLDNSQKSKFRKEINEIKEKALQSLAKGELEPSEKLVKDIFDKINEIKGVTKTA